VIRGDAGDVDLLDCPVPQPVGECDAGVALCREALEAAVRRFMPALAEDRLDVFKGRLGRRVEERAVRADPAVRGPAADVVGVLGKVRAGVVVPVGGGDDRCVLVGVAENVCTDPARDLGAPGHGEGPALAEVVLHVDQDQRPSEVGGHPSTLVEADQWRPPS